ncbi:T9SS type A sorting domain-containing protein [Spirosoma spitsbergense]|uniref:T9SS type A sorting domain-containing protein n=1 Tax=Spirosoma spitsbergense TaxID=431554 RepID=UPI00037F73C3|nr:T9SS type A sorting domain-containing protein [Spirosoma spitsbergense]
MKKNYLQFTQRLGLLLLWTSLLLSQTTWAQSIPDAQWARVGKTLIITTDGNIVTSERLSFPPTYPGSLGQFGDQLVKYSLAGDKLWSTGLIRGGDYIGGQIPGFDRQSIAEFKASAPSAGGGLIAAGPLNLNVGGEQVRVSVNGNISHEADHLGIIDPAGVSETGYVTLSYQNRPGGSSLIVQKYDAGNLIWTRNLDFPDVNYPDPNPPGVIHGITSGNFIIDTPDGGYLIAGAYDSNYKPVVAWAAKLDGNGNVSWKNFISPPPLTNPPGPDDINSMSSILDAIVSTDGTGYALVGRGRGTAYPTAYPNGDAIFLVEIDGNGNVRPGKVKAIDIQQTGRAYITPYTGSGGKKLYAVGNTSLQGRSDPQILLVDPAGINVVSKRIFPGPGASSLINIATAGDGSLVFVTDNNQLVKLQPEATTPPQPPVGALTLTAPTYNCSTGAFTFNTSGGNGSPIEYMAPGITGWTTNPNQFVDEGSRTALDVQPFTLTARQNGVTVTYIWDLRAYCSGTPPPPPVNPPVGGSLALTAPTYNCSTGAFTFNTSGGNGSTIEYMAPGITGWTTNPNQFVDQGSRTALDVQPFTLTARQNGVTVTYIWDLRAYCNGTPPPPPVTPPTVGDFALTAPTYNCSTGAFTFNTSGGNGSPIEYMAPGITGWTTNPNQFVDQGSRTANDVQPFTLTARQSGVTVTYVWNLKVACGRARTAALPEPGTQLRVRVLGNPVTTQTAEVEITGAEHQALQLNLVDLQGKVLHQRSIQQAEYTQRVSVPIGERSGVFLLNVSTSTQRQQVKLVKP